MRQPIEMKGRRAMADRFTRRFDGLAAWRRLSPRRQRLIGAAALELALCDIVECDPANDPSTLRPFDHAATALLNLLSERAARPLARHLDKGLPPVPSLIGPVCRKCGCSDDDACAGGCGWAEPDLCTSCAEPPERKHRPK
jgi:hypothetical protein